MLAKSDSACERYSGLTIRKVFEEFGKYLKARPAETKWCHQSSRSNSSGIICKPYLRSRWNSRVQFSYQGHHCKSIQRHCKGITLSRTLAGGNLPLTSTEVARQRATDAKALHKPTEASPKEEHKRCQAKASTPDGPTAPWVWNAARQLHRHPASQKELDQQGVSKLGSRRES